MKGRWIRVLGIVASSTGIATPMVAGAQGPAQSVGRVSFIDHGLSILPPGKQTLRGRVNDPLFALYGVRTRASQRASLRFVDGSILHMNQRTDLVLQSPRVATVNRGEVAVTGTHTVHHTIRTATAIAAAVGTTFNVLIAPPLQASSLGSRIHTEDTERFPPGTTTVSVIAGKVVVSNAYGTVTVLPGEWTHARPGQAPEAPTRHHARDDIAWTRGLPTS